MRRFVLSMILVLLAAGCAPMQQRPSDKTAEAGPRPAVLDRLYFGRSIAEGAVVSDEAWETFLREVVTPRIPQGFTTWRADGHWRDGSGKVMREMSFILEIVHPPANRTDTALREIEQEYKRRFRQESVLRVRESVGASF